MFGIEHLPELIVILLLALLFVGPGKLPDMGAALGKSLAEFRKATREVSGEFQTFQETPAPPRRPDDTTRSARRVGPPAQQPAVAALPVPGRQEPARPAPQER